MEDGPPSCQRTREASLLLALLADKISSSGGILTSGDEKLLQTKLNPATCLSPVAPKVKKLSALYQQERPRTMVQGSSSNPKEHEESAKKPETEAALPNQTPELPTPSQDAAPSSQQESAQDHPSSSVTKFEMLLRSAELEGKPSEDGQTPTSAGPQELGGTTAAGGLPQSPGLPPVTRKSFGSGKPYVPEGWSWRIVTDDFTKNDHYWSDVKYSKEGTNVMFQRRRPLIQYFMEASKWSEEVATQYVNTEFPRMRALLPADTVAYHPRKRAHKDVGSTDQGSEHNGDVLSSGSGEGKDEAGAGTEADGRAHKRVATRETRRTSEGDVLGGKGGKRDEFSPHVGMSRSVASLAQEVAMKRIFNALESRGRAAKKLREFLTEMENWSNLESNGTVHLELFEYLRNARNSDPQQLREYQELFLKHNLTKGDLEMEKRDVLQLFTVLMSHSEGVKQQNKGQLVEAIVNSPPWRTHAAGQQAARKSNHRKEGKEKEEKGSGKEGGRAAGTGSRTGGEAGKKGRASPGQAGAAELHVDRNGLDLNLALGSASGSKQSADRNGSSRSKDRPSSPGGVAPGAEATQPAPAAGDAAESPGNGLVPFPAPAALGDLGPGAAANDDAGPSETALAGLGEEGAVALQDVKKHERDLRGRLQAQAEHKQKEASADLEAAKLAKEAASSAEKELEEARVRLKKAEAAAKAARAKVKETSAKTAASAAMCSQAETTLKERLAGVERKARECEAALVRHLALQKQLEAVPKMPRDDEGMSAYVRFHVAVAESLKEYQVKRRELEALGPRSSDEG